MKKIILILFSVLTMLSFISFYISANEVEYKNLITDETDIIDDLNLLDIKVENYFVNNQDNDYNKFFVIACSDSYINYNTAKTYFYLYNAFTLDNIVNLKLDYVLNGKGSSINLNCVDYLSSYGLYKCIGFEYKYNVNDSIKVTNIYCKYEVEDLVNTDSYISYELNSPSVFESTISHNIDDYSFTIEFNTTLLINEMICVPVEIVPDDSFGSVWREFWDYEEKDLYLHFYNFNFPNDIDPDSVEYARFEYDLVHYKDVYNQTSLGNVDYTRTVVSRELQKKEYFPGSHTFSSNKCSMELDFDTFVLGNRIDKGEFGYLVFNDEQKSKFDYDCSILLDSTISTSIFKVTAQTDNIFELENIDFLELHYMKNDIYYKCQIISKPLEKEEPSITPSNPQPQESLWDKFVRWFKENFPNSLYLCLGVLFGGILLLPLIPQILSFVIYLFISILVLPFKLIKRLFRKKE